jgi:quercetin dioxygenase-like cupin family protein
MAFDVRRVVTGHDDTGRAVFVSDATPPATIETPTGIGSSVLFWLDGPAVDGDAGGDPDADRGLEPPVSGCIWRLVRLPVPPPDEPTERHWVRAGGDDDSPPGMHATDTLDFVMVLDGQLVLGLDDGDHLLRAGDAVVQRGTRHRWRVVGDRACLCSFLMIRPDPVAPRPSVALQPRAAASATGLGPRRLLTGLDSSGRSCAAFDGEAPVVLAPAGSTGSVMADLWQTGGRVARVDQGGDGEGPWELDPLGGGVAFRLAQLPAGDDPAARRWHTTASIDLVLILSGRIELSLPGLEPVILLPGEAVVQRATEHKWQPLGDDPVRMAAAMITVPG